MTLYKKRADLRMFLEVILSLSTVTVFLVFALKPTAITIIDLIQKIDQKKKTVESLDTKLTNLATAQGFFEQGGPISTVIESSVPSQPEPDSFSGQIQGIAAKNSVRLLGLSVGEITLQGKVTQKKKTNSDFKPLPSDAKEMPVSISATGTFSSLNSFIKDLEQIRRPIQVDVLGINSTQTDAGQIISVIISGRVPYLGKE